MLPLHKGTKASLVSLCTTLAHPSRYRPWMYTPSEGASRTFSTLSNLVTSATITTSSAV